MDIWEIYSRALAQYQAENYDAALKILDDLKRRAPDYRKAYSLEVCIWEKIGDPVKEFYALEKILPLFDLSVPEEKKFAADALTRMGNDLSALFMAECVFALFCKSKTRKSLRGEDLSGLARWSGNPSGP